MVDVYLGIGSNVDPKNSIINAKNLLEKAYPNIIFSRSFESQAIGFEGNDFLNLVAKIKVGNSSYSNETQISLLSKVFKNIESRLGRTARVEKFCSRVMDIDILLFGDQVFNSPITLPRDEILKNAYVLWPLSELAPELIHPVERKSYAQLWMNFDKTAQQLIPVDA